MSQDILHVLDYQTEKIVATLENREGIALFWNDAHRQALKDNIETFDFTMPANVKEAEYVQKRSRIILKDDDGFFREFIVNQAVQLNKTKEITSNASFTEIRKQRLIDPITLEGQTIISAGNYVLQGTDWKVGITEYAGTKQVVFDDYIDGLTAIKQVAALFNLEIRYRIEVKGSRIIGRYVDFIVKVGRKTNKEIEFGKDLIGIQRKENTDDLVTGLKVIGPETDGQRHVLLIRDSDALIRWGKDGKHLLEFYEPQVEGNISVQKLSELGHAELKKRINTLVEYTADAAAIENIFGYEHEKVRLGDSIRIKDTSYVPALYVEARVIEIERYPSQKTSKKYTLGDFIEYKESDILATWRRLQKTYAYKILRSQTEPAGSSNVLWIQTFSDSKVEIPHTWDANIQKWEKASPTQAAEIGAETPESAKEKAEAASIEKYINTVTAEKADLDVRHSEVYGNTSLIGDAKTNLSSKKTAFNTSYTNLVNSINAAVAGGQTTTTEKIDVDAKYDSYDLAKSALSGALEQAAKAIAKEEGKSLINRDGTVQGIEVAPNGDIVAVKGTGKRTLLSVDSTVPSMFDANFADPQVTGYGKIYTERVSIYVPAGSYNNGNFVEKTIQIKQYATVAIGAVSALFTQSTAKEWYAYERKDSRLDELGQPFSGTGDLYSFVLRVSPHYNYSSPGEYIEVDIMIVGWR